MHVTFDLHTPYWQDVKTCPDHTQEELQLVKGYTGVIEWTCAVTVLEVVIYQRISVSCSV